jgi:hypothetical protein
MVHILIVIAICGIARSANPMDHDEGCGDKVGKECKCYRTKTHVNPSGFVKKINESYYCDTNGYKCKLSCPVYEGGNGGHKCTINKYEFMILDNNITTKIEDNNSTGQGSMKMLSGVPVCCSTTKANNVICGEYHQDSRLDITKKQMIQCLNAMENFGPSSFFGIATNLDSDLYKITQDFLSDALLITNFPTQKISANGHLWYNNDDTISEIVAHWNGNRTRCHQVMSLVSMYYTRIDKKEWADSILFGLGLLKGADSKSIKDNKLILGTDLTQMASGIASKMVDIISSIVTLIRNSFKPSISVQISLFKYIMSESKKQTSEHCDTTLRELSKFLVKKIPAKECWKDLSLFIDISTDLYNVKIDGQKDVDERESKDKKSPLPEAKKDIKKIVESPKPNEKSNDDDDILLQMN